MEAFSFDDTLGELWKVSKEGLTPDQVFPVSSLEIYKVIADFGRGVGSDRTAPVETKYKNVDQKVRPITAPLPEDNCE